MKKLPDWLIHTVCILAPLICGFSIYQAIYSPLPMSMEILLYIVAFFFLAAFCLWVPTKGVRTVQALLAYLQTNCHALALISTNRVLRSILAAIPGTALGVLFAIFNAFLGIYYGSAWHGTLAGYFLVLTLLRILLIVCFRGRTRVNFLRQELRIYTLCGILLSVLSVTLSGAVILLIRGTGGKSYPGFLVYAMAAYTFYKMYASIHGLVTARRQESLLLIAQRNIGHADALMSLLSLQTGLLNAFGGGNMEYAERMNGITGGFVALIVLALGIHMVLDGQKRRKNP